MRYQLGIPKIYRTEAVVLKRISLGEADRIVTLYTPGFGKVKAVAKGIRRPGSRLGGHLELATRSELLIARGKNLDIITQGQAIDNYLPLKSDLWLTGLGFYVLEIVDRFTEENIENYAVYKLLVDTLGWLSASKDADVTLRFFEIHLLSHMGYRPQLENCVRCRSRCEERCTFNFDAGGVICEHCGKQEAKGIGISPGALKTLRFLQSNPHQLVERLKMGAGLKNEISEVLKTYIRYLLERELKSSEFLETIRHGAMLV